MSKPPYYYSGQVPFFQRPMAPANIRNALAPPSSSPTFTRPHHMPSMVPLGPPPTKPPPSDPPRSSRLRPTPSSPPSFSPTDLAILKGVRDQHYWCEKTELLPLTSNLFTLSHLSPLSPELESCLSVASSSLVRMKARTARHLTSLLAKREDAAQLTEACRKAASECCTDDIAKERSHLKEVRCRKKNREEYERVSEEVSRQPCMRDIKIATELEQKDICAVHQEEKGAYGRIEFKRRQVDVVLQAVDQCQKNVASPSFVTTSL
eukprot:GHVS01052015.1.p3 GENE.GHVS01052015.1~~GHVS01052015.1.p3  ORF type:complete len:264 (+),score=47.79 GHVS01052015.1:55-846(+)